jgi:hypothetical protein
MERFGRGRAGGWVFSGNVTKLCQTIAVYAKTRWDDLGQDAIDGFLGSTDSEANEWFEYVIAGAPELLIRLAIDVGTDVVEVRVRGDVGEVLAARIDTAIDLH